MMDLSTLRTSSGSRRSRRRVGRGESSGRGKTAGKGHKGQNARAGKKFNPDFEGGQMPLIRRIPKYGFTNIWKKEYAVINVKRLSGFESGATVDREALQKKGILRKKYSGPFKILGVGELKKGLTVKASAFSQKAKELIEKSGGKAEVVK